MVWNYYLRLLLGVFLFLFFSSGFFVMFLVNTSDQHLYQDEVSSEDVFESRNWEDIEKMLQEKLKQDRKEREKEWKSEFLLPVTDSAHTCKKRVIVVIYHRNFFWIFCKILG